MSSSDVAEHSSAGARPRRVGLFWWVTLAFALQAAAWTAWLVFAARNPVQEVPLVSVSGSR